jgi:hypothetical protein
VTVDSRLFTRIEGILQIQSMMDTSLDSVRQRETVDETVQADCSVYYPSLGQGHFDSVVDRSFTFCEMLWAPIVCNGKRLGNDTIGYLVR